MPSGAIWSLLSCPRTRRHARVQRNIALCISLSGCWQWTGKIVGDWDSAVSCLLLASQRWFGKGGMTQPGGELQTNVENIRTGDVSSLSVSQSFPLENITMKVDYRIIYTMAKVHDEWQQHFQYLRGVMRSDRFVSQKCLKSMSLTYMKRWLWAKS